GSEPHGWVPTGVANPVAGLASLGFVEPRLGARERQSPGCGTGIELHRELKLSGRHPQARSCSARPYLVSRARRLSGGCPNSVSDGSRGATTLAEVDEGGGGEGQILKF
ncbi:hypothetical protein CRG98_013899, partial [Punica granatum]